MRDSDKIVSTNHNLFEEKGEPKQNWAEALLLTSLMPYHKARPAHLKYQINTPASLVYLAAEGGKAAQGK